MDMFYLILGKMIFGFIVIFVGGILLGSLCYFIYTKGLRELWYMVKRLFPKYQFSEKELGLIIEKIKKAKVKNCPSDFLTTVTIKRKNRFVIMVFDKKTYKKYHFGLMKKEG